MDTTLGRPETRFAETPKGSVAYQVFGADGPPLVFITNWITNIDAMWDEPSAVRYLGRLGRMGRVVLIDKRGSGVSDRGMIDPVEGTIDDVRTVLDQLEIEEARLIGDTEGGMVAMVLAATYPRRFPSLILINSLARFSRADHYPIGAPPEVVEALSDQWREMYGVNADTLLITAPSMAADTRFRAFYTRYQRLAMGPAMARRAVEWISAADVTGVLSAIQASTLIIHNKHALFHQVQHGRYLAEHIENSRYVELEGTDTLPFHAGDFGPILDEVETFVTGSRALVDSNRMLSTVMFTDIVGSTAIATEMGDDRWLDLRTEHDRVVREMLARYRGKEITMTGDGCLAIFDGPQRAIQCALAIKTALEQIGVSIRAGVHTGEVEMRDSELGGLAVHIASRVMDAAESGGVMVSRTVKDLLVGSQLDFADCGVFDLKGVPGEWNLYEAREGSILV